MVKVNKDVAGNPLPCELYLDGREIKKSIWSDLYKRKQKDWDVIGMIVGEEGDGKTVLGLQRALHTNTKFRVHHIEFIDDNFLKIVNECEPGSTIVWDESDALGDHWASQIIRVLTKTFKRIRKKNLFIILITPSFFDLGKYFIMHRLRFLINVYSNGLQRGFYGYYNKTQLRKLYLQGKKEWDMDAVAPTFRGRFTDLPKDFPIDIGPGSEYDKKKDEATKRLSEENLTPKKAYKKGRNEYYVKIKDWLQTKNVEFNLEEWSEVMELSVPQLSIIYHEVKGDRDELDRK